MELAYFFDTYAFIEIVKENKNYLSYVSDVKVITTRLNLMELHYILLRNLSKNEADFYYSLLLPFAVDISDDVIKKANELKLFYKKRKLSYIDCIGYVLAKMHGVKFLTGDKEFRDLDSVEFVK